VQYTLKRHMRQYGANKVRHVSLMRHTVQTMRNTILLYMYTKSDCTGHMLCCVQCVCLSSHYAVQCTYRLMPSQVHIRVTLLSQEHLRQDCRSYQSFTSFVTYMIVGANIYVRVLTLYTEMLNFVGHAYF